MESMLSATSDQDYASQFEQCSPIAARRRASYLLADLTQAIESGDAEAIAAAELAIDEAGDDVALITHEDVEEAHRLALTSDSKPKSEAEIDAYMEGF
jgi:hypothetical protein